MKKKRAKQAVQRKSSKSHTLRIHSVDEIFQQMQKKQHWPKFILTSADNVKVLREWFNARPQDLLIELFGATIITPDEVMFI